MGKNGLRFRFLKSKKMFITNLLVTTNMLVELKVLEKEWLKLWLETVERNPHSKIELEQVKKMLAKLN